MTRKHPGALVLLVVLLPGCSSLGLAFAEDLTRISGELTNQQKTATQLADQIARVREAREAQESYLASKVAELDKLTSGTREQISGLESDAATGGVAIVLANLLMVYLQGNARNKSRSTLVGSILEVVMREVRGAPAKADKADKPK